MKRSIASAFLITIFLYVLPATVVTQGSADESVPPTRTQNPQAETTPVKVEPTAEDVDMPSRLTRILQSTGWFKSPQAIVREGVVTLNGTAKTQENRGWAGDLAAKTEGVVAVTNRIETEADVALALRWHSDHG